MNPTDPTAGSAPGSAPATNRPDARESRYHARYRDGYYVVIDTATGNTVPPDPGHYKKHLDGYLWDYAAAYAADDLNALDWQPADVPDRPQ